MTGSNVHPTMFVPVDWSVSIGQILGIPFAATVRQAIGIRTGFSAGHSTIKATRRVPPRRHHRIRIRQRPVRPAMARRAAEERQPGRLGRRCLGGRERHNHRLRREVLRRHRCRRVTADRYAGLSISIGVKRPPGTYTDLGELEGEWDGRDAVRLRAKPYIVVINPDGSTTVSGDIQPPDLEVTFELRRAQNDDSQTLQCS
ncbi:hypothetical protein [Plantactinospora sp. DSM 117369]